MVANWQIITLNNERSSRMNVAVIKGQFWGLLDGFTLCPLVFHCSVVEIISFCFRLEMLDIKKHIAIEYI